jgi:hypothetical protein
VGGRKTGGKINILSSRTVELSMTHAESCGTNVGAKRIKSKLFIYQMIYELGMAESETQQRML